MACGVKASGADDLALVATGDGRPVTAAGVFTSNRMTAPPVLVCREHLAATGGQAAAVVLNSGNANAATGADGQADAKTMCALTAAGVGCADNEVLVCSTGWIGFPLPMDSTSASRPRCCSTRSASTSRQSGRVSHQSFPGSKGRLGDFALSVQAPRPGPDLLPQWRREGPRG